MAKGEEAFSSATGRRRHQPASPPIACGDLRSLTSFEISVITATIMPASADAPEHCRVSVMVPPEINIQVNLPTAWNGRLLHVRQRRLGGRVV